MLKSLRNLLLLIVFIHLSSTTQATHIMGGGISYLYLGQDSATGNYQYQITLELFRLCDAGSSLLPIEMNIGVYIDDPNNPSGDKLSVLEDVLPLTIQKSITPPNGNDSCTFAPNVCVEKGVYEAQFSFPGSPASGFYFIADRCCRNNNILNLNNPGNAGEAYYASTPPPTIPNSSPTFATVPVPFICTQDTASILNQAFDSDGDSLVYNFAVPYNGISSNMDPAPAPPNPYPWPVVNVTYPPNFSVTNPFGPGGYANMNSSTGLASYYVPNQGFYVVAVEILEYRNGVLIGVSRRDIQIIVIACPVNPSPTLASSTSQVNYTVQEGDTLCFNSTFVDANGDSIFVSHTGTIFNGATTIPPATFVDSSGSGLATGQFCWATSCQQGNSIPYQFTVIANDNGCPAKTTNIVYTITVEKTPKPLSLTGLDSLCNSAATGITYTVPADSGFTFSWTVTNGVISGPSTGNSINVNFIGTGAATVTAATVNHNGCMSDTISKQVYIGTVPAASAGSDISFCSGANGSIGSASTAGVVYSWSPVAGLSSSTASNPTITLTNAGTLPVTSTYVLTTNLNGCLNTDTVDVTVNPVPVVDAGTAAALCSGNTITIGSASVAGNTYLWTPSTGLSNDTISNPTLTLSNGGTSPTTQTYTVVVQNTYACSATDNVTITVNPIPVSIAGADTSFCSGGSAIIGTASTAGYAYSWTPSTGLSSSTASNPTVTLTNGTGSPVTTSYIVTTSQNGCASTDTVDVTVNPNPVSNAGGNQLLCAGGTIQLGGPATVGYVYTWTPASGLNNTTISNPTLTLSNTGSDPDSLIYIVTTTLGGCTTSDTVQVISSPVSIANAGTDAAYCSGSSVQIGSPSQTNYTYSWTPATGLSSSTVSDPIVTLTNSTAAPVTTTFIVTTNLFGCLDADTIDVTVNPSPVSNAGANQLLCAGGTVQLGGPTTAGYVYTWTPATGLNNTGISDPTLTLSNTGTDPDTLQYIVSTDLNGCVTSDTVQIISSPVPTAIAGSDTSYCSGVTVTIGSPSQTNYVYSWTPSSGLSNATISDPVVTLTNTTTSPVTTSFILTTNLFGCLDADTVDITIRPNPVSVAGNDATLCGGDTLVLGTTSTSGYLYTWTPATGLNNTTISDPVLTVNNTSGSQTISTYIVTTELNGCFTSDSVTITINPQPVVSASVNPSAICLGDSATLTASGANTYGWALSTAPGTIVSTSANYTVSPAATTTYVLTGTNSSLCSNDNTVTLTVNPLPNVQITSASNTICDGDSLTLTATGAANYTWSVAGGGVIGTGPSIQVFPTSNTTYLVNGVSATLCDGSDSIVVTVNPAPTITAINGTTSVCPGVTGVQYWVVNPNPASSYNWTVTNGTIVNGQGTDTITVDWSVNSGTGVVSAIESTDLGCLSQAITLQVTINVFLNPIAPTGPTTICANAAQGVGYSTLNTPGSTYNWFAQGGTIASGNGTSNVTVNWTSSGTVLLWYQETSFTAVDTCFGSSDTLSVKINPRPATGNISGPVGICVVDTGSFTVVNTSTSSYNWFVNGGSILSGNGSNTVTVNWNGSGNATVSVVETDSLGCIGDTVVLPVNVNALPNASAGSDQSVCIGQGVYLHGNGGVSYSWSPGATLNNPGSQDPFATPTVLTEYVVLVTDANGCKNTDSVLVSVNALPAITLTANSAICIGKSITLTVGGGTSYQWSPAGSLDDASSDHPLATPVTTTTYTVVVTDQNTCVDSSTVTVTVNPLPVAVASASDTLVCDGSSTTLSASGGVSYSWTPASSLNDPNIANPVASPLTPTVYTVTVTDGNGCSNDASISLSINVQPKASFTIQDGNFLQGVTCDGYKGSLKNNSANALTYEWTFPNGSASTDFEPQAQLGLSGNNVITLMAINNICRDTTSVDFASTVIAQIYAQMPNVITPNGDGKNDCFEYGINVDLDNCSSIEVYDRWGKKVFEKSESHPCFNGRKDGDGSELSAGAYYVVVTIAGQVYHGAITLIR